MRLASYSVQVLDEQGQLVVGATLNCSDDAMARVRFERLPLPPGRAELWLGKRLVSTRSLSERQAGA